MMKARSVIQCMLLCAALAASACASTGKNPSATEGEKLFNDPQFAGSTNASSCTSCHPGGKGLENASANPKLFSVINACITGPLEGGAIAEDSLEMLSLKLYIASLGGEE